MGHEDVVKAKVLGASVSGWVDAVRLQEVADAVKVRILQTTTVRLQVVTAGRTLSKSIMRCRSSRQCSRMAV